MKVDAIKRACTAVGSKAALARAIGVKPPVIQQWLKGARPVPIARCVAIEKITNGVVNRIELRADWAAYWPELARDS